MDRWASLAMISRGSEEVKGSPLWPLLSWLSLQVALCFAIVCPRCIHLSSSRLWAPPGARVEFGKEVHALPTAAGLSSSAIQAHFISMGPPRCRRGKIIVFALLRARATERAEGT